MNAEIIIIRGLPGAGKSTLADSIAHGLPVCEADKYDGLYSTDADGTVHFHGGDKVNGVPMIALAHQACQEACRISLRENGRAIVANTFTQGWEFAEYIQIAEEYGARIVVVDVFDGGCSDEVLAARNTHGVPLAGIKAMRARWEGDWRSADKRPPWQR